MTNLYPYTNNRRSIRLTKYDYSWPGAYFVTICTHHRMEIFGKIIDRKIELNELGEIVNEEWSKSEIIRFEIKMDLFAIMPNHIHGIVMIKPNVGDGHVGAHGRAPLRRNNTIPYRAPKSLGSFIAGFKSICTRRINQLRETPGKPVWQRNYHEHIIRDENSLRKIREYIVNNSFAWQMDKYHVSSRSNS